MLKHYAMYRMLFAVVATAVAPTSVAQASGLEPSNGSVPSNPTRFSTHFAWADVLRVEPVYAMVPVRQPVTGCAGATGKMRAGSGMDDDRMTAGPVPRPGSAAISTAMPSKPNGGTIEDADTGLVEAQSVQGALVSASTLIPCQGRARAYEERLDGYDVEYRYRGEVYLSRLDYDPGERLRVRVSVSPAN